MKGRSSTFQTGICRDCKAEVPTMKVTTTLRCNNCLYKRARKLSKVIIFPEQDDVIRI